MAHIPDHLPHAHLANDLRRKELGPVGHFLDGIMDHGLVGAVIIIGLTVTWSYFVGDFDWRIIPVALLAAEVATGLKGITDWRQAKHRKAIYDSPRMQAYLRRVENRAKHVVASQRGTAWILMDPANLDPETARSVLSEKEYRAYRRHRLASGQPMEEVRIGPHRIRRISLPAGRQHRAARDTMKSLTGAAHESSRLDRWTGEVAASAPGPGPAGAAPKAGGRSKGPSLPSGGQPDLTPQPGVAEQPEPSVAAGSSERLKVGEDDPQNAGTTELKPDDFGSSRSEP